MLKVERVSKSFGSVKALRNATIIVGAHEVVGLIGENGAGKSTLMRILSGGMRPDTGTIAVGGSPVVLRDTSHASRYGIAMVFQEQFCSSICRSPTTSISRMSGRSRGSG